MLNAQHNNNLVQIKDSNTKKQSRSSAVQQLNVWIKKETKAALARQAKLDQRSMGAIVEELIHHSTSHEQAELVERQSLGVVRE